MIPTAEEYIRKNLIDYWEGGKAQYDESDVKNAMIAFAKLHVEAATKAIAEQAIAKEDPSDYGTGKIWVDKDSILNAYPLTNIK
jgi:hypothetical protein